MKKKKKKNKKRDRTVEDVVDSLANTMTTTVMQLSNLVSNQATQIDQLNKSLLNMLELQAEEQRQHRGNNDRLAESLVNALRESDSRLYQFHHRSA